MKNNDKKKSLKEHIDRLIKQKLDEIIGPPSQLGPEDKEQSHDLFKYNDAFINDNDELGLEFDIITDSKNIEAKKDFYTDRIMGRDYEIKNLQKIVYEIYNTLKKVIDLIPIDRDNPIYDIEIPNGDSIGTFVIVFDVDKEIEIGGGAFNKLRGQIKSAFINKQYPLQLIIYKQGKKE
jgi:hypothetical protein